MQTNSNSPSPLASEPSKVPIPSVGKPPRPAWLRLPKEPDGAYQDFLQYIKESCAIAGLIAEARMPLNYEILQHGPPDPDCLREAFHWYERLPSFFDTIATNLREHLEQERRERPPTRFYN